MVIKFFLKHGDSEKNYGKVSFNGKFCFELDNKISIDEWNKIGFIKLLEGNNVIESQNLFEHLNARLPITLRNKSNQEKIEYIMKTNLRVVSDSFYLEEIKD